MCQYVRGEKTIGQIIDEQPTAYDVDEKILYMENEIYELKGVHDTATHEYIKNKAESKIEGLKDAIEIVKACEQQTMIRTFNGRKYHAPTNCYTKLEDTKNGRTL
jgi:hypothetical protein